MAPVSMNFRPQNCGAVLRTVPTTRTGHALAGGFDNRTTFLQRSLQPEMTPVPITLFYTAKSRAVIQALPAAG
jgi:hypothetical protein